MLNLIKPVILNLRSNRAKMCKHVNPCCIFSLFAFFSNQMTNLNKRQYCWKNELENELLLRNIPYIFFLLAQLYPKNLFSQLYMIFYSLLLFAPGPILYPGPILCKQQTMRSTVYRSFSSKICSQQNTTGIFVWLIFCSLLLWS